MELLKDIYFNTDKLVENTNVKVSYTGKFYQGNNDKVFIHYGYGKNWDNVQEVEMKKTDLGYQAEVNLAGNETINFCFKNNNNEWDNNLGQNYIFNIEKANNNDLGATIIGTPEIVSDNELVQNVPNAIDAVFETNKNEADYIIDIQDQLDEQYNKVYQEFKTDSTEKINSIVNTAAKLDERKVNTESNITALAVTNTKFQNAINWTRKVKDCVVKFFASVPKFVSGNYKRIVEKNSK